VEHQDGLPVHLVVFDCDVRRRDHGAVHQVIQVVPELFRVLAVEPGDRQLILSVPETSSMSRDQAIFVDRATGASLSQYAVVLKIDGSGSGFSGAASSSDR
jgi:hypothetical protein